MCAPTELPDLRRIDLMSLDIETKDDRLRANMGSGWPTGEGYICGVSVAYREGGDIRARYLPIRHPGSANLDPEQGFAWLRDLVASKVRIVTQGGLYDWGWLRSDANIVMPPAERLEEIGALATIVDENRKRYALDDLCKWRGVPGKNDSTLKEGAAALGLPKRANLTANLWQMPAHFVGPYAEQDAICTLLLFESLNPVLDHEGTRDAYRLEVDLLPMVLEMRRRGIRIGVTAAERARDHLLEKRDAAFAELSEKLGANVGMAEIGRTKWLAETFDRHGIKYPRTAKGNPSFTAGTSGWMHRHEHWLPQLIVRADKLNNAALNFLQHYILDHVVNGRIHAEIHPHRSDEGGTRSLRFSYSKPPLQLMSAHDEEIAPLIRGVFLPEEGEVWAKPDVSQQEFRFIVHYAAELKLPRAKEAVARYRDDPNTDFHALVDEWTGIGRRQAKNTNFAKAYRAGVPKFAAMIGKSESEAHKIYAHYDRELPFVAALGKHCEMQAKRFGYVELYDGARRHWNTWVAWADWKKGAGPCAREEAERRIADPNHSWYRRGPLRRADTHKALNALIQGSAARHTKLWMRACYREGIVPLLQMHDSLDCSVSSPEQAERVAQLAREVVSLAVPIRVDIGFGHNWADAKHSWAELERLPPAIQSASAPSFLPTVSKINDVAAHIAAAEESITLSKTPPLADLIGEPLINGKVCCPFHEDSTPSLQFYDDHYHCFGCGAHGDAIDWLRDVEGMDYSAATELLSSWSGPVAQSRPSGDPCSLAFALRLWEAARPIAGTLAIKYLADIRGIDVAALSPEIDQVLRFHPFCPFGPGPSHPCLLALFRDVETDAPAGIHRIALSPETLAGGKVKRRMLGRWPTARAIKLWPAGSRLFVAEGIETALAAATRLQFRGGPMQPAWATGSSGNIAKFPVLPGVEQLVLLVDYDPAGETAAETCRRTWREARRDVVRLRPTCNGADFNDLVLEKLRAVS